MARKIQPRSKIPKPKRGQSSEDYWREREERQRAVNIREEARTASRINEIFRIMQDNIQQEIESFYQRYANKEGITLLEARGRVSRIDMEQYERLAKKYVEAAHRGDSDLAFSDEANEQMRLYNATMRINRLEMLKARCGIRAMEGYRDTERLINDNLEERAYTEYSRLAGILGNSVQFNENMTRAIVNASYQNATWSQRLWTHQATLSERIGAQLAQGILTGKSSTVLAREIQKLTGGSTYACQRLMRTELRRVQTEAALQSMTDNGVTEYKFIVANGVNPCEECLALDGQVFKLSDMNVGKNAPPVHPSCHCCLAPYVDETKWQRWLDGPAQAGVPWAEFEQNGASLEEQEANSFGIDNPKIDYASAHTFSGGDLRLMNMLRSGDVQKACDAVNEILNKSDYNLPRSYWSGNAYVGRIQDMIGILGRKEYWCDITIREDQRYNIKTIIHENLHARSMSLYPESQRQSIYQTYRRIEEGVIEYLSQEICKKSNIPYKGSYSEWVNSLKSLKRIIDPMSSDYDFAKTLIDIPLNERYNYIKQKIEQHKQSSKTIRYSVSSRLENILKDLSEEGD